VIQTLRRVLVGVSVDALLLTLKEALEREAFRADIVGVVDAWRDETLAALESRE